VLLLLVAAARHLAAQLQRFAVELSGAAVESEREARRTKQLESARRASEDLRANAEERSAFLERVQKDKDGLVQLVVHDLRSPLTVCMGNIDLASFLLDKPTAKDKAREALDEALAGAQRMQAMLGDILHVAKLEDGRLRVARRPVDVSALSERVARQATVLARGRTARIERLIAPGLRAELDHDLTMRLLENVVSNASRFVSPDGRIRVSARAVEGEVVLVVANDGPPVDPRLKTRLFEKYEQGKTGGSGWGLGLYFCRLVAEAHGGRIGLVDLPGFAAAFEIRLPLAGP
jgi:two-component system heavy metal sensor histidine kinase CusS